MSLAVVYVTVGTTKFDSLILEVTSPRALEALRTRGCRTLVLQVGTGTGAPVNCGQIERKYGIRVEQYDFKFEPTRTDMLNADLVIGHAGAGTCMDILNCAKPGLIVINEALMDNHQLELALQLAAEGYIYYCGVSQVARQLEALDFQALKPYHRDSDEGMAKFVTYLSDMLASH